MREIKFREPMKCKNCGNIRFRYQWWERGKWRWDDFMPLRERCCSKWSYECVDENNEIEQYTGLKDKAGVEAYENDRIKSKHYGKGTIIWWGNGWAVESDDQGKDGIHFSLDYEFEVIGNIHQNPDIL